MYHVHHLQCLPPSLNALVGRTQRRVDVPAPTEAELERQARAEGTAMLVIRAYVGKRLKGRRQV